MKKSIVTLVALACFIGPTQLVQAQNTQTEKKNLPVKIGLVDMAKVFKEYDKFTSLRESLQAEMKVTLGDAQKIAEDAKKLQEELKLLKPGSPDHLKREAELAGLSAQFEAKRKLANANYVRKEAEIFETVYKEAHAVVKIYAEHFDFTVVVRFNSEALDSENPQKLANGLNKLVVYHRPQDDISDAVIEYLNRQYKKTIAAGTKPGTSRN